MLPNLQFPDTHSGKAGNPNFYVQYDDNKILITNSHFFYEYWEGRTNISAGQVSPMGYQYITTNLNQNSSRMEKVR